MTQLLLSSIYSILSDLLEQYTGQILLPNRYARAELALRPILRQHGIPDMTKLGYLLGLRNNPSLERQCVEVLINNETCFFRDQANFALLTGPVLDSIRERRIATRRIRIWSSACSTGQEAYSLAMAIAENANKWNGWNIQIVATDVSHSALAQARAGRYSQFEIQRGMPVLLMLKHFNQENEEWVAKNSLRNMISFGEHNLLNPALQLGQFDIILCRNILMYLTEENRAAVFNQLSKTMAGDGMLVLGAAETVIGQSDAFRPSKEYRGYYEKAGHPQDSYEFEVLRSKTA
jgi:chemotaxis protein methyltransferase CheR